jgi:hypothetical protein
MIVLRQRVLPQNRQTSSDANASSDALQSGAAIQTLFLFGHCVHLKS